MNQKKFKRVLFLLLLASFSSVVADVVQMVPGQNTQSPYEESDGINTGTPFILGSVEEDLINKTKTSAQSDLISPQSQGDDWTKKYTSDAEKLSNNGEYLEFRNKDLTKDLFQVSKSALTFSYIYDTYTYSDRNNIFNSIFKNKDSKDSKQSGFLHLGYTKYFHRGVFDLYWKTSGGLSFNTGKGKFSDNGELSRTTFKVWNFPLEFTLGTKINIGRYFGLNLNGGGALVATYQSRSDRKAGEDGKEVKQLLYGYTGEAALEVSLSQMMPSFSQSLRANSEVGDFSLAFTAKVLEVSNSKADEYQISGASFGLGFKFELL